jgi:hypothetical protein
MGMWALAYATVAALLLGPTPAGADEIGQIDTPARIAAHDGWVVTIQRIAIPALAPIRLRPHSPFS